MKVEQFNCLKCGTNIELVYLPDMAKETVKFFEELKEIKLCLRCEKSPTVELYKPFLN
jgi:NAD-dependent SIR2 family protein deacetylase